MMKAVRGFLRDWRLLLYWVFFKPTALRAHINQIAPRYEERLLKADRALVGRASVNWGELRDNPALRAFVVRALFAIVITPFVIDVTIGLAITVLSGAYWWKTSLFITAFGVAYGVVAGVARGVVGVVAQGVTVSVRRGVAAGVAAGVAPGILFWAWLWAWAKSWDLIFAPVMFIDDVFSALGAPIIGETFPTVVIGVVIKVVITVVIMEVVTVVIAVLRQLLYFFEVLPAALAYRRSIRSNQFEKELLCSPIYFDEFIFFPQPYLSSMLFNVLQQDLTAGLKQAAFIATHPYQSWASQRALKKLLAQDRAPFFLVLDRMLASPVPYEPLTFDIDDLRRTSFRYHSVLSLLGEIADVSWPVMLNRWTREIIYWLGFRTRDKSRHAPFAGVYFDLLQAYRRVGDDLFDREETDANAIIEDYSLDDAVAQFEGARELPHGEEFYKTLRLIEAGLHCENLQNVAKLRSEFTPLFEIDNLLRPQIVVFFRRLCDAAIDAASFLTAAHEMTRRNALLKAGGALEEARQLADKVYEPERSLLLAVIEHWRRMSAVEGGRVAERVEVKTLPNPFIAGRPIRPEDGQLFVGRRDEFRAIEEKLQTGVGIVIYGQRRIGKSSILLHLRERLPHHLLPVYLNLQSLMANTTGGFLWAVGNEAVKELRGKLPTTPTLPSAEEFTREPYLSFNRLLEEIERQLQPEQRVLLSFDEFEELEQRVKAGRIEPEIFAYLRGITQTGHRFAMLFAGLHTLEQMTREYWNPFFQSVQTIRIGYLGELDARQLITDPIDQFPLAYDEEAIDRITEVTNAHPYLAQSVCHNLVNRLNDPLYRSNRATAEDVDAVLERTLESSGYYFDDYVWGWSNQDERLALALIAEAGDEANFAVIAKHLGREAALKATQSLVARDIIAERTERDDLIFRFRIPLSRMWVRRTKSSARILLERGIE